jgi:hypothetical protein
VCHETFKLLLENSPDSTNIRNHRYDIHYLRMQWFRRQWHCGYDCDPDGRQRSCGTGESCGYG